MPGVSNDLGQAEEFSLGKDSYLPTSEGMLEEEELLLPTIPTIDYSQQNVAVLSILLALALIANLSAFPVILFRRTRSRHLENIL